MRVLSNLDADLNRIMRVPAPDADMDAVSKAYVEDVSQGIYDDLFAYGASITFLATRYDILSSGWDIAEIWTYVSPTSFSINGDKRDKYQKGDKIRLKQGGDWKYFYITGVSYSAPNTIVTITGGSDYTLANAAIQNNHYSKAMNPQGWPVSLGQRVGDKEIWHEGNDTGLLRYRGALPDTANFNDAEYKNMGVWRIGDAASHTNGPGFSWGTLICIGSSGSYGRQEAFRYDGGLRKVRYWSTSSYTDWVNSAL